MGFIPEIDTLMFNVVPVLPTVDYRFSAGLSLVLDVTVPSPIQSQL